LLVLKTTEKREETRCISAAPKRNIFCMTPATRRTKPTDGALRAAKEIERNSSFIESTAEVIDRETGVRAFLQKLAET
jgi:hypothetical protein